MKWFEADSVFESPVKINAYAKVYGLLRVQNDSRHIFTVSIQPLEHLNELLSHLLEVTYVTLQAERIKDGVLKTDTSFAGSAMAVDNSDGPSGLNADQKAVMKIIMNHTVDDNGVERGFIKSKVPPSVVSSVDKILDILSSEGHIYTTKTDDYFRAI